MTGKPVIPRERAKTDIKEAIDSYLIDGGPAVALGFIDALEAAFQQIAHHPASGSSRYAHELAIPGLRSWPLKRYPYLAFYLERVDCLDVWRVLHGERDIPAWMQEPEPGER